MRVAKLPTLLKMLVVAAAVLAAAYYRWSRRRLYRLARQIPSGMKAYPVVGHAYKFLGSNKDIMKTIQDFGRTANRQNGLSTFWMFNRLFVDMTHPEAIEVVSKTCLHKDEFIVRFMQTVVGNGSIFAPVNIWHPRRKRLASLFSLRNLNLFVKEFDEQSRIMADLLQSKAGRGDFSIWKYMTSYTLDAIFETMGDHQLRCQGISEHFLLRAIAELTRMIGQRMMQPWLHPDLVYERLPVYKRFQDLKTKVQEYAMDIVQKKKKTNADASEDKCFNNNAKISLFDLGARGKGFSDLELREEAIVLCVAGTDTSAVAASFTAVLLARYPDVQEKLYQEIQEVFGDSDRPIGHEDHPRLKYLDAVLKESLRLYPPVPMVFREIRDDDVVLPSGTALVEGTSVTFNIWGTHRNPAYWGEDAELFRPERFLEGPLRHPAQFIPFSYSVRNCIGGTYAMLSAKTGLANLVRRYKLLPPTNLAPEDFTKPLEVTYEIMMKAVDNFIVRIEERNKTK